QFRCGGSRTTGFVQPRGARRSSRTETARGFSEVEGTVGHVAGVCEAVARPWSRAIDRSGAGGAGKHLHPRADEDSGCERRGEGVHGEAQGHLEASLKVKSYSR